MEEWDYSKLFFDFLSKVLRIRNIIHMTLKWDNWNVVFPIKVLINYHSKEIGFIYSCTTSFRTITSFWGVIIFLRDNIIICVLFTLRVSLLESNHNATLANSVTHVFRISIAVSIESAVRIHIYLNKYHATSYYNIIQFYLKTKSKKIKQ